MSHADAPEVDLMDIEQDDRDALADAETGAVGHGECVQMDVSDSRRGSIEEEALAHAEQELHKPSPGPSGGVSHFLKYIYSKLENALPPATEYLPSKVCPSKRLGLHRAKMAFFRGIGPDPSIISLPEELGIKFSSFNPLFDDLWLPWARKVRYIDHEDFSMVVAHREYTENGLRGRDMGMKYSYAVPSRQILEYMVQRAPDGKIAEIGAGSGYWSALLQHLGANIVAVDNVSDGIRPIYFPACKQQDGAEFLKDGGADGRVLFLCWPQNPKDNPSILSILENYPGDTIFFVGEVGRDWTLDILAWVLEHKDVGWQIEETIEIPSWPCAYDKFFCVSKKSAS